MPNDLKTTELTDAEVAEMFGGTFHAFDAWLLTRPDLARAGTARQLNEFEIWNSKSPFRQRLWNYAKWRSALRSRWFRYNVRWPRRNGRMA